MTGLLVCGVLPFLTLRMKFEIKWHLDSYDQWKGSVDEEIFCHECDISSVSIGE